jgi:hypothetical protein
MAITKEQSSISWLISKARSPSGMRAKILSAQDQSRDMTVLGKLYFFSYDPKHKNKLPLYDSYPLVFPIERYADGFLGINLHYLPFSERQFMLKKLLELRTNNNLTKNTKLRLTYDVLSSARRLRLLIPCVKRYLSGHVRSPFIEIPSEEWGNVINLPLESWVRKV